jgi:hypothetical protein
MESLTGHINAKGHLILTDCLDPSSHHLAMLLVPFLTQSGPLFVDLRQGEAAALSQLPLENWRDILILYAVPLL